MINTLGKNKYLNIALEASLKAGEAIIDVYDSAFDVEYKYE